MAKFKHIDGGIAEVFTRVNINRLEQDKNYERIQENTSDNVINKTKKKKSTKNSAEVEKEQPLQ